MAAEISIRHPGLRSNHLVPQGAVQLEAVLCVRALTVRGEERGTASPGDFPGFAQSAGREQGLGWPVVAPSCVWRPDRSRTRAGRRVHTVGPLRHMRDTKWRGCHSPALKPRGTSSGVAHSQELGAETKSVCLTEPLSLRPWLASTPAEVSTSLRWGGALNTGRPRFIADTIHGTAPDTPPDTPVSLCPVRESEPVN